MAWTHNNLWGNAQKMRISPHYETNFSGYTKERVELTYGEPYLLGTTFKGGMNIFAQRERRDTEEADVIGSNINLGKYMSPYAQGVLRYQYENVVTKNDSTTERWISSLLLSLSYDRKNDIFYPSKGMVSLVTHQYAGGILGGDVDYQKIIVENILYRKVLPGVVATRAKAGCIWDDRNMLPQDKFAIGGMGSVRGFDEESIGPVVNGRRRANLMVVINFEYRLPVFKRFELAYFFDTGGLWKDSKSIGITENIGISGGVGIGYRSPIGPIRLDYAHRLNGPSGGNFYLKIGYML
jgi:outer membrane protein insertion porin family